MYLKFQVTEIDWKFDENALREVNAKCLIDVKKLNSDKIIWCFDIVNTFDGGRKIVCTYNSFNFDTFSHNLVVKFHTNI